MLGDLWSAFLMWAMTRGTTTAEPQHSGSILRPIAWCLGDQSCFYPSSSRQRSNGPRRRPLGRGGAQATSGKSPDFSESGPEGSRRLESQRAESEASREAPAGGRGAAAARGLGVPCAYREVCAAQRLHQLRLVLVRLLRQLKGLLNREQPLLRPHDAGTTRERAPSATCCSWPARTRTE